MRQGSTAALVLCVTLSGCAEPPASTPVDLPAGPSALAPRLEAATDGALLLTWLEPIGGGHALKLSRLPAGGAAWSSPQTVLQGSDLFANWADLPGAVEAPGGGSLAHGLRKNGTDPYAYGVVLAASGPGGAWTEIGSLHDDASPAEHGFVAWATEGGQPRAFWLDGRAAAAGGGTQLRTRLPLADPAGRETVLDDRVCDCCSVDAAQTRRGPVVVYRDRTSGEVRDISLVRAVSGSWSAPVPVHADGWTIPGCPVNGPAVAAEGDRVIVAWFTGAQDRPRVLAAWSADGGATFAPPVVIDDRSPAGRVDVVLAGDRAIVTWIGEGAGGTAVRARGLGAAGTAGPVRDVAPTTTSRASGFPRAARRGDDLLVVWPADGGIRGARIPLGAI